MISVHAWVGMMEETRDALRHLGIVMTVLLALAITTYLVPSFARFQPWQIGDPVPLASLFDRAAPMPSFAGTGNVDSVDPAELEEELGESVAANLGDEPEEPPPGPLVQIAPREYAGIEVEIEDPTGRGMRPFYEALRRTALAEEGAITRIAHYGDSSIATDLITHTVRRRLQRRFGDAGHGFMLMGRGYLPYRHRDIVHSASGDWMLREIVRNHDPAGLYGFGGIQFRGRPGGWSRFATVDEGPVGTHISRFEIWFQRHRRGGHIHYFVDGGPRQIIETRQDVTEDDIERIELPDGDHRLEVRFGGHGQPRLYGVVLENEGPGVVYDSLGLVGARAARLLNFDAEHIQGQLDRRRTQLLILGFGGNEADDNVQRDRYETDYRRVIQRMRAQREDLACLVFAPLDQAERSRRGRIETMATIPDIVAAQRAAAEDAGCAFFDTWQAMGGEGSMGRWHRTRPRLAMSDLRHATPAGYEVIGNLFYKSLLKGFDEYLHSRAAEPAE